MERMTESPSSKKEVMPDRRRIAVLGRCLLLSATCLLAASPAAAQLAEKPSVYTAKRLGEKMVPASAALAPPPADARPVANTSGHRPAPKAGGISHLDAVASMDQFLGISRVYNADSAEPIVHTIFAIDRAHGNRVYFINANRYALHEDFLRGQFLVPHLDEITLKSYYQRPDRRFLLGTIGLQPQLKRWTFEFWEGDQVNEALIQLASQRLAASFFQPLLFKANSTQHETVAKAAGIELVTEAQILDGRSFMPLNTGRAQGRLRLIARLDDEAGEDIEPTDIVVLKEVPLSLAPVAGVVTERPSTVLSHVNLLVKGWGVPNAYIRNAFEELKGHDGQWVELTVTGMRYDVRRLPGPVTLPPRPPATVVGKPDLAQHRVLPLTDIALHGKKACGSKATNLSRIEAARRDARLRGDFGSVAPVPDGFCIPYAHYAAFIRSPEAQALIQRRFATPGFERSRSVRRHALEQLRAELVNLPLDPARSADWLRQWQRQLSGKSVFVRSSSNSEDLANFSGAGLYTTVPNAKTDEALLAAVKAVWASVYNAEAYEARRAAGVRDDHVYMAVLVQVAVDSVVSGVMITRDPFDARHANATYVSAKRGLGIKVVEGKQVAEQSLHDGWSGAVRRLSRSAEASELKLDHAGGVVEMPLDAAAAEKDVLSTASVKALADVGRRLKALFGQVDQDIEWAIDPAGRIVVLQSRPYVERKLL